MSDFELRVGQAYLDAMVAGEPLPGNPTREELVRWLALERAYAVQVEQERDEWMLECGELRSCGITPLVSEVQRLRELAAMEEQHEANT